MKRKEKTFGLIAAFALVIAVAISFRVMGNGVAFAEDGYRITFDANGHGTVPAPITVTVYINWENPETPSDPDYAFCGWYLEPECVTPFQPDAMLTSDVTLYAKWMPKDEAVFQIRFMPNSGEGTMESIAVKAGTFWELPECLYTPGYGGTFRGWSIIDIWAYTTLSGYRQTGAKVLVDRDITLMAMWTESGDAVYTITEGADIRGPINPLKTLTYRIERTPDGDWSDLLVSVTVDVTALIKDDEYRIRKSDPKVLEVYGTALSWLSEGYHQITFAFADGEISTSLYVEFEAVPTETPTPTEAPKPTDEPGPGGDPNGEPEPTATVTPGEGGDITGTPKDYEIGEKYPSKDKRDPNAGLDLPWLWIGVGAFAVVLIIVILVLLRKRRKK